MKTLVLKFNVPESPECAFLAFEKTAHVFYMCEVDTNIQLKVTHH